MNLGPMEIGLILLAILLLFGYKKLPDASRSFGRSLRIFKGEMKGMKDDDAPRTDTSDGAVPAALPLPPTGEQEGGAGVPAHRGHGGPAPSAAADSAR